MLGSFPILVQRLSLLELSACRLGSGRQSWEAAAGGQLRQWSSQAAGASAQSAAPKAFKSAFDNRYKMPPWRVKLAKILRVLMPVITGTAIYYAWVTPGQDEDEFSTLPMEMARAPLINRSVVLTNWSGTHSVKPRFHYEPEAEKVVDDAVANAHRYNLKMRIVGSGLSPNGMGFSDDGVVGMGKLNKVISVDKGKMQVRVAAGARVAEVDQALEKYGLSLANFASIHQQQLGGLTQVGAHGTGARIPPTDDQVVSMRLVTPAKGPMKLSATENPELFSFAKVGLGGLGVVTELTLQAVPRVRLAEHTFTTTRKEVRKHHGEWLAAHSHLRYLWIPYTDTVVVVTADPVNDEGAAAAEAKEAETPKQSEEQRLAPLRDLYRKHLRGDPEGLSAAQLRDELLLVDPLNRSWVTRVNSAEAAVWSRSSGWRVGAPSEILGFECGGQQWVMETALPVGSLVSKQVSSTHVDLDYVEELLDLVKRHKIPAHGPIEQRWSASSTSAMSPASAAVAGPDCVHSWVGIIMYLPDDEAKRTKVTAAFRKYAELVETKLMPKYNAVWHWAKLEVTEDDPARMERVRERLAARYPVDRYNSWRDKMDPRNVMANKWLDSILPRVLPERAAVRQPGL